MSEDVTVFRRERMSAGAIVLMWSASSSNRTKRQLMQGEST
jgi:hypothetical protein